MLFYILLVAVLNLGLGFATAYYLGQRHCTRAAGSGDRWTKATHGAPARGSATAGQANTGGGPEPTVEKSPSEKSIEDLQNQVRAFHEQLCRLDDQLRSCAENPEAAKIESCLGSLKAANKDYLQNRDQAHQAFKRLHDAEEEFQAVHDDLQAAIQRQTEQIEETEKSAESFVYEGDLGEGCRQMIDRNSKLLDVGYLLRDKLDGARIEVARSRQSLGSAEGAPEKDPLTGISSRVGLEATLLEWWEKDPHRARQLTVAMLDIDQFAKVNQRHGHQTGDKIIHALAQLMVAECREHDILGRFSGQKFMFLFPDTDVRYVTSLVEQIRQTIEMVHFERQESEIQVTLSCAVTAADSEDTPEVLFARAEETVAEAKSCGGNRTHLNEGQHSAPVVPPNLMMSEKSIPF